MEPEDGKHTSTDLLKYWKQRESFGFQGPPDLSAYSDETWESSSQSVNASTSAPSHLSLLNQEPRKGKNRKKVVKSRSDGKDINDIRIVLEDEDAPTTTSINTPKGKKDKEEREGISFEVVPQRRSKLTLSGSSAGSTSPQSPRKRRATEHPGTDGSCLWKDERPRSPSGETTPRRPSSPSAFVARGISKEMPLIRHPSLGGQRARKLMNQRSVGDVDAAARNRSMTHGDKRNVVVSYSFDDGIVSSASPKSNPKTDTEDSEGIPEPYVPLPLDTKEDVDREQPEVEETGEACGAASAESEKEGTAVKRSSKSKTSAAKKKKGTIGRKLGSSGRDKDKKRAKLEDLFDMNDAANYDSAAQYYQIRRLIVHRSTMEVRSNASTSATPPGPSPLEARVVAETLSGGRKKSFSHRSAPIQAEIASSCIVGSVLSSMPTGENGTPLFLSEVHAFFATHSVDMANARLCQLGLKSAQVQLFLRDLEANLFTISDLSRWISTWKAEAPLEPIVEEPAVAESEDKDAVGVAGAVSGEVLPPQFQKKNSTFKRGWDTIRMKKKRKSSAFPSNSVLDKEPWMSFTWKDFVTEIGELISAILLLFLEKMPKALMTDSYDRFANVVLCVDEAFKEEFTRSLIFALPVQNRKCLQTVLEIINEMEAAMETPSQTVAEKQCYYCRTALLCNIFGDLLFRQRTASTEAQINKCDMGDCEKESAKLCNSGLIVRYLVDNWKELFLVDPACDGIIYEIRNGKALVKAAQIEKIIVKLLDPWSLDKNFVDIVFLTHHYFIPSCELLELLVARYDAESEQKWKIQMRMRVLGLLRMWLEDQQLRLRPEQQFAELLQKYVNEWSSHSKIPGEVRLMKSLLLPFNTPLAEAVIFPELCKATSPLGEDSQPYSYSIVPMLSPRASVNYSPQNAGTGSTKKPHLSRTSSDSSIVEKRTVRREKPSPDLARKAGRSGTKSGKAGSLMKSTRSVRASHNDSESPGRASSPGSGGESRRTSGGKSSEINEGGTSKPFTFPGKALIVVKVSESKLNLRWNFTEKTPIRSQSWALYGRIAGEEEWKVYDYRSKRFVIMRERSFSIPGDQYRCTVQGLESDTQYELNIRFAVEGQGWGPKLKENISVTTLAGKSGLVKKLRKRTEIGGKKWNREKEKDSEKSDKEAEKDSEKDQKKLQEKIQETLEKSQEVNEDEAKSVEEKGVLADDDENLEESEGDEEEDGELAQLSKKCSSKSRLSIENPPESYMSDGEMGRSTPCSPQSRGDAYTPPLQTVSQHTKKGAFQKVISVSFISTDRKAAREAHPLEESKLAEASSGGDASPVSQCRTPDPTSLVASEGDRIEASLRASCGNRILESAKPKDLAETICVIDHRLLAAIPSHEFLKQSFMKPNMAPAFAQFVSCFNKWSMWACTEICHRTDTHYRSMMLDKVIRTAAKCLEYNNFSAAYAIVAGLQNTSISRLQLTWDRLSKKTRQKYDLLAALFDIEADHKAYRQAFAQCHPPAIPYLGLFRRLILSIEETEDVFMEGKDHYVHVRGRLHSLWLVVNEIKQYQRFGYSFIVSRDLLSHMYQTEYLDEEKCYEMSLVCEPRKPKK